MRLGSILDLMDGNPRPAGTVWERGPDITKGSFEVRPGVVKFSDAANCASPYSEYQRAVSLRSRYLSMFWDRREYIAEVHGISTEDLEIVVDVRAEARVIRSNQLSPCSLQATEIEGIHEMPPKSNGGDAHYCLAPPDLFFQITATDEELSRGDMQSWGNWSFDSEYQPDLLLDMSADGCALFQRCMSRYLRLPYFETDLVTKFRSQEQCLTSP